MPQVIRIRDVVHERVYELGPEQRALRVPYDMFHPRGAVHVRESDVEWTEGQSMRRARVAEALLGDCHPGERVLLPLSLESNEEWWLCDVEAVDGVTGD